MTYEPRNDMSVNPQFKRLFMCIEAYRLGFIKGCRPFIGLDGCHLKGRYGGILLSAVAVDGNSGLFPVAFAVVESECKDSWMFFLYQLATAFHGLDLDSVLTFMSDKQKGLIDALSETFLPESHHRFCARHLYNNFKVKHPGVFLRTYFWAAAKAPNPFLFEKAMEAIKKHKLEVFEWLAKIPKNMWARHGFDHRAKSDHITNNMTESFNQWVSTLRDKPILTLFDQIRIRLMSRLQARYEKGCTYKGKITPRMKKKLDLIQEDSRWCSALSAGSDEYEVSEGVTRFVVSLKNQTCGCKVWEVTGLPCKHAVAAIALKRGNLEDYCSPYFTTARYLLAHGDMIHPLPDISQLDIGTEGNIVQPPVLRRQLGRPHRTRRREPDEQPPSDFRKRAASVRCDICKEVGHNKRTCQRAPVRGKRKRKSNIRTESNEGPQGQDCCTSSQVETRSQTSYASPNESVKAHHRAHMAEKLARLKSKGNRS